MTLVETYQQMIEYKTLPLVYTVGKMSIYEPYIANNPGTAGKRHGGSVWQTAVEAAKYARKGFKVYGVKDCNWETDTAPDGKNPWHKLLVSKKLVQLT